MKRSRRSNRSGLGAGLRSLLGKRARPQSSAAALTGAAGGIGDFEQLESRQLLFTLTVPGDPSQIGTVAANFAYFIPYLAPTVPFTTLSPQTQTEDFDAGAGATINIPTGSVFLQSNLRVDYTATSVTRVPLFLPGIPPQQDGGGLRVVIAGGQELSFSIQPTAFVGLLERKGMAQFVFETDAGFDPNDFTVDLLFTGEVLYSFTAGTLFGRGTPSGNLNSPTRYTLPEDLAVPPGQLFDQVRIRANPGAPSTNFLIDNVNWIEEENPFAETLSSRNFGARLVYSGPGGSSITVTDLYGRDMRADVPGLTFPVGIDNEGPIEIALGDIGGGIIRGDRNLDGIPEFNDGIGKIVISGANGAGSFTLFGATIGQAQGGLPTFTLVDSIDGLYDDFEQGGMGFVARLNPGTNPPTWTVTGLPPGPGSVIIGSPFVRPQNDYNPGGPAAGPFNFSRPDQGIFVTGGDSFRTAYAHAMLFGNSQFTGYVDRVVVGTFLGSASVAGDVGDFIVGGDAGLIVDENGGAAASTSSQLAIGRTVRDIQVGGRSAMNVTVIGDLNHPNTRPARDVLRYTEQEVVYHGVLPPATIGTLIGTTLNRTGRTDQQIVFNTSFLRNDTLMSAEWVGSAATSVEINGDVGGAGDVYNTREDPSDVFAFAADGTQDINVQVGGLRPYVRIVDANGRTVAASPFPANLGVAAVIRYRPTTPGVYYLVVTSDSDNTSVARALYTINLSGLAPSTLGAYRTASGYGTGSPGITAITNVLNGSMGSLRVGTGFINGGGAESDPADIYNQINGDSLDTAMSYRISTTVVSGTLYNVTTGVDVKAGVTLTVGGDLGTFITGQSPVIGLSNRNGDFRLITLTVGGSIGMIDARGSIGINQDPDPLPRQPDLAGTVVIRTGTDPRRRGDIGMIRAGWHVGGDTMVVRTPNGSVVGAFLVSQDIVVPIDTAFTGIYGAGLNPGQAADFRLGLNSDLRFFDSPNIDIQNLPSQFFTLVPGQTRTFTDDAGGQVRIQIIGGNVNAGARIRVLPVGNSLGVAIGRIDVNLDGGARLQITSLGPVGSTDVVSIGRIVVQGSDAASSIGIDGTTQVDVYRIDQAGGDAFNEIVNLTPGGDIVTIDMVALNRLELRTGDLGRTQVPAWGPRQIGPFLGITAQAQGEVGGPIPLPAGVMTGFWNGNLQRPVNLADNRGGVSFLDDVGSPMDPYLDGLMVRTGNLTTVQVGGAIGDVLVPAGNIVTVIANFDLTRLAGHFDGLVGTIYGVRISNVDIGDGLAPRTQSPLSTTGIFALDDILLVTGGRIPGANIESTIAAANQVVGNNDPNGFPTDGIDRITLTGGGSFIGAFITATNLDGFWLSLFAGDDGFFAGDIGLIQGIGANFLRSDIVADVLVNATFTGGFYDASRTATRGDIIRMEAMGYRNSTITGTPLEFQLNSVTSGGDVRVLTTTGRAGDIEDLSVDALGRILDLSAFNLTRSRLNADLGVELMTLEGSMRSSNITAGLLTKGDVKGSIRSSEIFISGPLLNLTAADAITNTNIVVSGPDGRIDLIKARTEFSGSVSAAGPIDTIEVTEGDLLIRLTTLTNQRGVAGDVKLLKAARDLDVHGDIGGTVEQFVAGRHFGRQFVRRVLVVHGDVQKIDVAGGQLYTDLRITQTLQEAIIGTAVNLPGGSNLGTGSIYASGRIENVTINGDFGANIISASGGIGVITLNDGSLLPTSQIAAYDGTLNNIVINNGHLMGSVHADWNLLSIRLNGSADGVFGDLGVNPNLSSGAAAGPNRNQLPPGVIATSAINGPRITAGFNLGRIILTNGSIFEAYIYAGRAIGTIDVIGDITSDALTAGQSTVIAAGSSIFLIHATGVITNTDVIVGVRSFGADDRPGGVGADADTIRSGRLETLRGDAGGANVRVSAGMLAGPDGQYNTGDELVAPGISFVRSVTFGTPATNVSVFADSPTLATSAGVATGGDDLANVDPDLSTGAATGTQLVSGVPLAFTWNGVSGSILYTGPGEVFWDPATGTLQLINAKLTTDLTVNAGGTLTDFRIVTNDDASMGTITVNAPLAGNSVIDVDAYVLGINVGAVGGNTRIKAGMNLRSVVTGDFTGGSIDAAFWVRDIVVNGNYGDPNLSGEASIHALAGAAITIAGNNSGLINIERDLSALSVGGSMVLGQFRAGSSVGAITLGALDRSRISVADNIGTLDVAGHVNETAIQAGGDLGDDAAPGGAGFNADRPTTGSIGTVSVGGNFVRSSIVAGFLRGPDGFFGTPDDEIAPGRSNIGDVSIGGFAEGSNLNTEQYRITATGVVGDVDIDGIPPAPTPNFVVGATKTDVLPIQVLDIRVEQTGGVWQATLFFNQAINVSTVPPAISIAEVRPGGVLIPLVQGVDYTVGDYDAVRNALAIFFSSDVTGRNLVAPGVPDPANAGPGVFRFTLDADVLRAAVADARLDGDSNGIANPGEDYSQDTIVGDAGDQFIPQIVPTGTGQIDLYGPADLDQVLDNNATPDTLPDINVVYTLRGTIGDHPDNDVIDFLAGSDTDIYKITLQAGQILRLGAMSGAAQFSGRFLYNAAGEVQFFSTPDTLQLPVDPFTVLDLTQADAFLVKTTGVYFIAVTNQNPFVLPTGPFEFLIPPGNGTTGSYEFTVEVFDDGDSGFDAATNAGNGTPVVNAPTVLTFAGPNGVFQDPSDPTYDDFSVVTIGAYKFFLDAGADGVRGTADDTVSGTNDAGIVSSRSGSQITTTIKSAIGNLGHSGVPGSVSADVDIYHLNNGQTIAPGKVITIKIKLADLGADLGSFSALTFASFLGDVQFGVFDTTGASGIDDATLVFSPTDFKPISGKPGELARVGQNAYGFDASGDFFITFATPNRVGGTPGEAASLAVYLQGAFNTDYVIEISQDESNSGSIPQAPQNIFLETRGGAISWLEAGGITTKLDAFASSVLGFTGTIGGVPVDQYILTRVVSNLQSIFAATGFNVVVSTNPNAFEFQPFSTVFLTRSTDPINSPVADIYGYSEHSDAYNLDRNDEAVVFLPTLADLGYTPAQADIDNFVLSLTAAVGRRVGELMGLRLTDFDEPVNPVDIMAANSVPAPTIPGFTPQYRYIDANRALSGRFDSIVDTNFFLGQQNAFALLDKFLTP